MLKKSEIIVKVQLVDGAVCADVFDEKLKASSVRPAPENRADVYMLKLKYGYLNNGEW